MALQHKDRKIADLHAYGASVQKQNTELLSAILSCSNGNGFWLELNEYNQVLVEKCIVQHEWVNGKFYYGLNGRRVQSQISQRKGSKQL